MRLLFNVLAVSGSAMYAGVMLAIGAILGGYWKSLPATDFVDSFSNHARYIARAILPVLIPALVGLAGSLCLSWGDKGTFTLWLSAVACVAVVLVLTMTWFGPTNAQFTTRSLSMDQVPAKLEAWLMFHTARISLTAVASTLGVIAIRR